MLIPTARIGAGQSEVAAGSAELPAGVDGGGSYLRTV